jgi:threonine/homoserine/homoserine lactone efflux protein
MTLVTALKDYVEVVHKLTETAPAYINNHTDYTDFITLSTYLFSTIKQGVFSFLSFEWASNLFYLPIIVPQMASAMFSEISVFDGQFHNLFTFLDGPVTQNFNFVNAGTGVASADIMGPSGYLKNVNDLSLPISLFDKFLIGVSNSLFFWIPTSAATFLCLRRFAMQGVESGYAAALGTLTANLFWLASVVLGLRFIVIPWTSFDLARYWLGFLLLVKYFWDNRLPSKEVKLFNGSSSPNARMNIFGFHFLLALTEQSSLYPFLTNLSSSSQATALESFSANNSSEFFSLHIFYLLGIFIGSFSLIHIICFLLEEPAYSVYLWFTKNSEKFFFNFKTVGDFVRIVHFFFQTVTLIFALSSLPYLGIEYAITNPLGFVPNDQIFHQFKQTALLTHSTSPTYYRSRSNFVGQKFFRYDDWEEFYQKNIPLDTSLYDQGSYRLYTMEDLHYGADYEWLRRRSEKVKIRGRMKKLRWFPRAWANRFWDLAKVWSRRNVAWRNEILSQYEASWDSKGAPALNKLMREKVLASTSSNPNSTATGTTQPWGTDPDWGSKFFASGQGFWWDWSQKNNNNRIFSDNDIWWNWLTSFKNSEKGTIQTNSQSFNTDSSNSVKSPFSLFSFTKQKEKSPDFWMPQERMVSLYSEQTLQKTNRQLTRELSLLRKFVRKFQNRIQTKGSDLSLLNLQTVVNSNKVVIKRLSFNNKNQKKEILNKNLTTILKRKTDNSIIPPLMNEQNINDSIGTKQLPFLLNGEQKISEKTNNILKYKALIYGSSFNTERNGENSNSEKSDSLKETQKKDASLSMLLNPNRSDFSTTPVLLHPIQFYLHKQQGFVRKLRFYGAQASREFENGNNAPAMRFYLRTYFQNYKPTRLYIKSIKMKRHLGVGAWNRIKQMTYADAKNKRSRILSRTPWIRQWVSEEGFLARRKRLEAWIKRQHYDPDELWSVLMKADIDSFIARQPFSHSLTTNEERLLHLRRFLLFEHYDSLRWYTYMQHYRTMKTRLGGTKSFTSRMYNQQFKGTFHKVRHLFALTPSASAGSVLKFDQPLYNEFNNHSLFTVDSSLLHEELLKDPNSFLKNGIKTSSSFNGNASFREVAGQSETDSVNNNSKNLNLTSNKDLIEQSLDVVREYIIQATPLRLEIKQQLLREKNYDELTRFLWIGQKNKNIGNLTSENNFVNILKDKLLIKNKTSSKTNLTAFKGNDDSATFFSQNSGGNSSLISILEKRLNISKEFQKGAKDYKRASERLWAKWKKRFSWEQAGLKVPYRVFLNHSEKTVSLFCKEDTNNSKQNRLANMLKNDFNPTDLTPSFNNKNLSTSMLLTKIQGILSTTQFKNNSTPLKKSVDLEMRDIPNISTNGVVSIQKALKKAVNSYQNSKSLNSFSLLLKNAQEPSLINGKTTSFNALLKQRLIDYKRDILKVDKHATKTKIRNLIDKNNKKIFLKIQNLLLYSFQKANFKRTTDFLPFQNNKFINFKNSNSSKIEFKMSTKNLKSQKFSSFQKSYRSFSEVVPNLNRITYTKNRILRNRTNLRESLLNIKNSLSIQNKKAAIRALRHQKRGAPGRRPKALYTKKQNVLYDKTFLSKEGSSENLPLQAFNSELMFKNVDLSEFNKQIKLSNYQEINKKNLILFNNKKDSSLLSETKFKETYLQKNNNLEELFQKNHTDLPYYFESNRILPNSLYDSDLLKKSNYAGIRGSGVQFRTFNDSLGSPPLSQRLARAKQRRKQSQYKVKRKLLRRHLNRLSRQKWSIYASTSLQNELEQNNSGILQKLRENVKKKSSVFFFLKENLANSNRFLLNNNGNIRFDQTTLSVLNESVNNVSKPFTIFKDGQKLKNPTDSLILNKDKQKMKRNIAMFLNFKKSRDIYSVLIKETPNQNFKKYESLSESAILSSRASFISLLKRNKLISSTDSNGLKVNSPFLNFKEFSPSQNFVLNKADGLFENKTRTRVPFLKDGEKTGLFFPQPFKQDFSLVNGHLLALFKKRAQRSMIKAKQTLLPSLILKAGDNIKRNYYGSVQDKFTLINKGNRTRRTLRKSGPTLNQKRNLIRNGLNYLNKKKEFGKVDKDIFKNEKVGVLKNMIGMTSWLQETKNTNVSYPTSMNLIKQDLSNLNQTSDNTFNNKVQSFNKQRGSFSEPMRSQKWVLEGILRPKRITSQQAHNKRYSHLRKTPRPKRLSRLLSLNDHPLKQRSKNEKSFYEAQQSLKNFNNFAFLSEKQKYQTDVMNSLRNQKSSSKYVLSKMLPKFEQQYYMDLISKNQQDSFKKDLNEKEFNKNNMSNKEIIMRNLNSNIDSFNTNNPNFLQIGDRDSKPLAVPIAIQIREKLYSNQNNITEQKPASQKQSSIQGLNKNLTPKDDILNNLSKNLFLTPLKIVEKDSLLKSSLLEKDSQISTTVGVNAGEPFQKRNLLNTNPIPFYAGWDESLRKFVVTNRLLSRKEAGYSFNSFLKKQNEKNGGEKTGMFFPLSNGIDKSLNVEMEPSLFLNWPLQGRNAATTLFSHLPFMTPPSTKSFQNSNEGDIIKYQLSKEIVQKSTSSTTDSLKKDLSSDNSSKQVSEITELKMQKKLELERIKKNTKVGSSDRSNRKVTNLVLIDQIKKRRSALFAPLRWRSLKNTSQRVIVKTNLSLSNSNKSVPPRSLNSSFQNKNTSLSQKTKNISQKISPKYNLLRSLRKGYKAKQRLPRLRNFLTSDENSSWKWNDFLSRRIQQKAYFGTQKRDGQTSFEFKAKLGQKLGWQKFRWVARNKRSLSRHVVGKSDSRRKQKRNNRQKIYLRPRKRPLRRRSLGVRLNRLNSIYHGSTLSINQSLSAAPSLENFQSPLLVKDANEGGGNNTLSSVSQTNAVSPGYEAIQSINRWSQKNNQNPSSLNQRKIYRNFFTPPSINVPVLYEVLPGHSRFIPLIQKRPAPGSSVTTVQRAAKWQILENSSALQREALMHGWATRQLLQNMLQKNNDLQNIPFKKDFEKNFSNKIALNNQRILTEKDSFEHVLNRPFNSVLLNHSEFFNKKLSISSSNKRGVNNPFENKRRQLHRRTLKLRQLSYTLPMRLYDRWFFYYYLGGREDPLQNLFSNFNKFVGQNHLNSISLEKEKRRAFLKDDQNLDNTIEEGLSNASIKNNVATDSKLNNKAPSSFLFDRFFKQGSLFVKDRQFSESGSLFNFKKDSLRKVRRFITLKAEESVSFESYLQSLKTRAETKKDKKKVVQAKSRKMKDFSSNNTEQKQTEKIEQSGLSNSLQNSNMWWYNFRLFNSSLNDENLKDTLNKGRTLKRDENLQDMLLFYKFDRAPSLEDFRSPISSNRHYPLNGGFVWPGDYLRLQTIKIPKERKMNYLLNQNLLSTINDKSIKENGKLSLDNNVNLTGVLNRQDSLKIQKNYNSYTDNMLMSFSKFKNPNNTADLEKISNNLLLNKNEAVENLREGSAKLVSKNLEMTFSHRNQLKEKVKNLKVVMGELE